jgi:hypothetical protein
LQIASDMIHCVMDPFLSCTILFPQLEQITDCSDCATSPLPTSQLQVPGLMIHCVIVASFFGRRDFPHFVQVSSLPVIVKLLF